MSNYVVVIMRGDMVERVIGPMRRENAEHIAKAYTRAFALPLQPV